MVRIVGTSVAALWFAVLSAEGEQAEKSMTAHFIEVGQADPTFPLLARPCSDPTQFSAQCRDAFGIRTVQVGCDG